MREQYGIHPSTALVRLFRERPYQGQSPAHARVLVLGTDANYSPELSATPFFSSILEYHADGVVFWRKHSVHHPFLLAEYPFDRRTGGRRYHANFAKMGFGPEDAEAFSFVELLHVPTTGNAGTDRRRFLDMLDRYHLQQVEDWTLGIGPKLVLANQTLVRTLNVIRRRMQVMERLYSLLEGASLHSTVDAGGGTWIFTGYHFSHAVSDAYLHRVAVEVRTFLRAQGPANSPFSL